MAHRARGQGLLSRGHPRAAPRGAHAEAARPPARAVRCGDGGGLGRRSRAPGLARHAGGAVLRRRPGARASPRSRLGQDRRRRSRASHPDARLALHAARRVRYRRARARVGARGTRHVVGAGSDRACLRAFNVHHVSASAPHHLRGRRARPLARFRRRDERRCAVRHLPLLPRPLDEARHHSAHRGRGRIA